MAWRKGQTFSPEHRAKLSAARKGRTTSPETRAKLSAAGKGRVFSPEHRAKLSAANRRRTHSPETRARMSAAQKGHQISPEARARMSAALKGRPGRTPSPEERARISAALKGRTKSAEHRARIGAANKGRTHSPAARARMSAARTGCRVVSKIDLDRDPSLKAILDQRRAGRSESATSPGRPVFIGGQVAIVSSDEQARIIELLDRKPRRRYSLAEIGKQAEVKEPRKVLAKLLKHPTVGALIDEEVGDYGSKFYRVVEFRT
jgi:hypothetical protein